MKEEISIHEAQRMVDCWIKEYGGKYFDILTNMAILTEEVGEVARVVARKYGEQTAKSGDERDLADELCDVIWVVMAIANQTGIDITDAFRKNIEKKTIRDKSRHIKTN